MTNEPFKLYQGDCLEVMKDIPAGSIDLILTDPPYGTTSCPWDSVIPFAPMWNEIKRIRRQYSATVLFGQEPFSSLLRVSNISEFKYDWYWRKSRPAGFTNAKLKPLKDIEVISVFSDGNTANGSSINMMYYPQGVKSVDKEWKRPRRYVGTKGVSPSRKSHSLNRVITQEGYPRQILDYSNSNTKLLHPTQKPVALLEYLIMTYTNEGDTILDFTMGSGSTGVAAANSRRSFIGIEQDETYFGIAKTRIEEAYNKPSLENFLE